MAAKVAADLRRMRWYYGSPSDADIAMYEEEVVELLKRGYLGTVIYGFKKDGNFIAPTLRYTAVQLADGNAPDDDPGRVPANCNVTGAAFYSFLTFSNTWWDLTPVQRQQFEGTLSLKRSVAQAPGASCPYISDRNYAAGGQSLGRSTLRSN
jgi:hypothetical protein